MTEFPGMAGSYPAQALGNAMWMSKPANRDRTDGTDVPDRPALPAACGSILVAPQVPAPCNDPGRPPRGAHGATVLLICTGLNADDLQLDVVLTNDRGRETVLRGGVSERDAIAEARRLAALHGAPLAMLSLSGHLVQLESAPHPAPRRLGSPLSGRRPRFLANRQVGLSAKAASGVERQGDPGQERGYDRREPGIGGKPGGKNESGIAV